MINRRTIVAPLFCMLVVALGGCLGPAVHIHEWTVSPNQENVAAVVDGHLEIVQISSGHRQELKTQGTARALQWVSDTELFYLVHPGELTTHDQRGSVWAMNISTGEAHELFADDIQRFAAMPSGFVWAHYERLGNSSYSAVVMARFANITSESILNYVVVDRIVPTGDGALLEVRRNGTLEWMEIRPGDSEPRTLLTSAQLVSAGLQAPAHSDCPAYQDGKLRLVSAVSNPTSPRNPTITQATFDIANETLAIAGIKPKDGCLLDDGTLLYKRHWQTSQNKDELWIDRPDGRSHRLIP